MADKSDKKSRKAISLNSKIMRVYDDCSAVHASISEKKTVLRLADIS
jgi:hypothetical protein